MVGLRPDASWLQGTFQGTGVARGNPMPLSPGIPPPPEAASDGHVLRGELLARHGLQAPGGGGKRRRSV